MATMRTPAEVIGKLTKAEELDAQSLVERAELVLAEKDSASFIPPFSHTAATVQEVARAAQAAGWPVMLDERTGRLDIYRPK